MKSAPPPKPKVLSMAQLRARAEAREAQGRFAALRELSHFGKAICSLCTHDRESHVLEDGREVCLDCWDSRLRPHQFKSMYRAAHEFFQENPLGGIASDTLRVVDYSEQSDEPRMRHPSTQGERHMSTKTAPKPRTEKPAARTRPQRDPEPEVEANTCLCGCETPTKGRFAPGHDARLKSRLVNAALGEGGENAKERAKAEKQLDQLGWSHFLEKARESRAAKAEAKAEKKTTGRTAAQKAATEKMRSASKSKAKAKVEDDEDELDDDFEDEDSDDVEDEDDE